MTKSTKKDTVFTRGDEVLLKSGHPWKGHFGVVTGEKETVLGVMIEIVLDNGMECLAFEKYIQRP